MSERRDLLAFAVQLSKEVPTLSTHAAADLACNLISLATPYRRLQEQACNVGLSDTEKARERAIERAAVDLLHGTGIDPQFEGDPRGFTFRLKLPSGASNNFDGEAWGVPNS